MKFDTSNDAQKDLLWKQYGAWDCNGCTAAPTILSFKSSCSSWTILAINPTKKYILTCETVLDIGMILKNQAEMIQN